MKYTHTPIVGLLSLVAMVAFAGCSSTDGTSPSAPSTSVATVTESPSSAATSTSTTSSTSTPSTGPYVITNERVVGATGRATYDVTIPQLSGGRPAVTAEFNRSTRSALQDQINGNYNRGGRFTLGNNDPKGPFHIGRRVISAEQITSLSAEPTRAQGDSVIATVTIDTDTAKSITLQDAFGNLDAGLTRLSKQSARLLSGMSSKPSSNSGGLAPRLENYANWTASQQGMDIHFGNNQVGGPGLTTITIPWSSLSDVLAPGMQAVLSS